MGEYPKEWWVKRLDNKLLPAEDLSRDQRDFLVNLNKRLMALEDEIETESRRLKNIGDNRLHDPDDWVEDYMIEFFITFNLDHNDPEYNEDDDNVLVQIEETGYAPWETPEVRSDNRQINFSEFASIKGHPMENEHHCYLFHDLYDHKKLGWSNVLRIGSFDFDARIEFMKEVQINKLR